MILKEGPFSSWDSESSEVDMSTDLQHLEYREYLEMQVLVQQFLELPWAQEEEFLEGFPH